MSFYDLIANGVACVSVAEAYIRGTLIKTSCIVSSRTRVFWAVPLICLVFTGVSPSDPPRVHGH